MYKNGVIRLTLLLVPLFNINRISVLAQGLFNVKEEKDKALYGYSFLNITETSMERCLAKCLENCLCMSFQMCEQEGCQLCSSDKAEQSASAFREKKGCTYYAFQKDLSKVKNQQCQTSCLTGINCCTTSKPCMNNGTCEPASLTSSTDTTTRFKCKCPANYTGNLCQYPIRKSCRDYLNGDRLTGKYKITDDNQKPFEVFCNFNSIGTAWTLIQSYQLQNKIKFQKPLFENDPVNEETPAWDSYRLSKSRMESIQQDSEKWRITCQYDTDGLVRTDYVRGSNDEVNILNSHDECIEMERVDIRGQSCNGCTIHVVQLLDKTFHLKSFNPGCTFPVTGDVMACGQEDNFGFYACINPAHRCSATATSTTQIWFGGR